MSVTIRTLGDLSVSKEISKNTTIVKETDQTLSSFILKLNSKYTSFLIDINGIMRIKFTPEEMYQNGFTREMRWLPWLQTYDDTNDIYVIVFEPYEALDFKNLNITLYPSGTVSYSYLVVLNTKARR